MRGWPIIDACGAATADSSNVSSRIPARAAMGREHFTVNRFDGFDRQILERLAQDKRLKSAAFFLIKRFAVLAAVSGSITGWIGVKTIEPPG